MIFLFDENMPPKLARAIIELSKGDNHQILLIRDEFGAGTSDVSWMTQAHVKYGPDVVAITCDHYIRKRPHEILAFKQNDLRAFILPKLFNQYKYWDKSAFLVRWWPKIVETAEASATGELFLVPGRQTPQKLKAY
ncbi:hypothetical protein TH9_19550 [Thalassospira xiamenensis]|nr:hypothetical protein TH9_19550 [Thalassospira xiamenensis]